MFIIVLQREFDFSCDDHRATAPPLPSTAINRRHWIWTCLEKKSNITRTNLSNTTILQYFKITNSPFTYSKTGQGCARGKVSRMQPGIHVIHVDHRVARACSRSSADDRSAARLRQAAPVIYKKSRSRSMRRETKSNTIVRNYYLEKQYNKFICFD